MTAVAKEFLILELKTEMTLRRGRRVAGDCSRSRRFALNPAKAAYYAVHRSRRFARRLLNDGPSQPSDQKAGAA
jgi:hypothetical protein